MGPSPSCRHLTISLSKLNRCAGKSLTSGLAYICRLRLRDERLDKVHNHTRKGGVLGTGSYGWAGNIDSLRRAASTAERRADAVEGREAILAFPEELPQDVCMALLLHLAEWLFENYRVAAVYALHAPDKDGDERNIHGHLVWTSREVCDEEGAPTLGKKTRVWDSKEGPKQVEKLRAYWCSTLNRTLEARGAEANIEHRSFARLGIDRVPDKHRGVAKTARMRRAAKLDAEKATPSNGAIRPPLPTPKLDPVPASRPKLNSELAHSVEANQTIVTHSESAAAEFEAKARDVSNLTNLSHISRPVPVPQISPQLVPTDPSR